MKKRISLVILSLFILLMFTGCTTSKQDNETNKNDIVSNVEEQNNVEMDTVNDDNTLLTEEDALKLGYDLYNYGLSPAHYDSETNESYLGKSKKIEKYEESTELDKVFLAYPFGTNEDIDNYFTDKKIKELEEQDEPYRIKKIDGVWYFGHAPVGSEVDFLGVILTVKSIEENRVEFTATNYNSFEYLQNGMEDYEKYAGKELYEYIDEFKTKYQCETDDYDFVIVKEGENWKIDEQTLAHY